MQTGEARSAWEQRFLQFKWGSRNAINVALTVKIDFHADFSLVSPLMSQARFDRAFDFIVV